MHTPAKQITFVGQTLLIMSTRETAELTNKRHDNVMADFRKLAGFYAEAYSPKKSGQSVKSSAYTGDPRDDHAKGRREPREGHATQGKGKEGKEGKEYSAELDASNSTPASPIELDLVGGSQGQIEALVNIPLNDGTEHPVTQGMVDEWALTYPAIDVLQKLREMRAWCLANNGNRKTLLGVEGV